MWRLNIAGQKIRSLDCRHWPRNWLTARYRSSLPVAAPFRPWPQNRRRQQFQLSSSGEILTNLHVVKGQSQVAVVFKPTVEGSIPTRDDIKLGQVIKYDAVTDLAVVRATDVPKGRIPIRLGDSSEMAIGADVSAIGHPEDQAWTFTKGIISQYRIGFQWLDHKADVIQTQTPINPGNSGGPLISETGSLIGVNSFKKPDSEGLNFSVSVDEVKRFLARKGDRPARSNETPE